MSRVTFSIATAPNPGAIGIIQLYGENVSALLAALTSRPATPGRSFLADLGGIDEGLVAVLRHDWAQLMPHGGPRVMQRLVDRLRELGAETASDPLARQIYPEAGSDLEADMLAMLARAPSPAAIDVLLAQPRAWREVLQAKARGPRRSPGFTPDPRDHLVTPPSVVLVGRANVGKSTLTNLVLGRAASITSDLPGTTRDWVAGLAHLATPIGELAVLWIDTPGIRSTADPIERRAQELARGVIEAADVLIAVRDPELDYPALTGRQPDLFVLNKADLLESQISNFKFQFSNFESQIAISALTGEGLEGLSAAVLKHLGLAAIDAAAPWVFSAELRRIVERNDRAALERYAGAV